jgi:hypothetical protein
MPAPAYRSEGPPDPLMRLTAPIVAASTLVVFATGVLLLIAGPSGRGHYLFLHRASFVTWLAVTAVPVLGHLVDLRRSLCRRINPARCPDRRRALPGAGSPSPARWPEG